MRKLKLTELNRISIQEFKATEKTTIRLVMDNVRSALNVGSAFRTADAFALEHLHLCGISAQPPHREILKTAIGATQSVDWSYFEDSVEAVQALKEAGYQVWGVEQTDESILLQEVPFEKFEKQALVFGNEVEGIRDELLPLLDGCIEVPQFGTKHSLNVSVCLGIVVWEAFRKINYEL